MTAVRAAQLDEQAFGETLDRWSPSLLGLAGAFSDDAATAERLVEAGWLDALRGGRLDDPAGGIRVAVVRAMTDPQSPGGDPAVAAARRELRLAVRASGVLVLPAQRDRRSSTPVLLPASLTPADLRRLAPPLRLVLLLSDVQRWPAAEVEELLGGRPLARRAILGHARRSLAIAVAPLAASA